MATTPQAQVIWTPGTEIYEQWSSCASENSQISPSGTGTAGRGTKHGGCVCTFPRLTPRSLQLLSQPSHRPSMQQELGPTSSTGAGWGQGAGLQWLPVSPTWPVQHKAATAAAGTQAQLHRLHHSHCLKAQASAVEFLLSVPTGKCQIMCQYNSVMCDSTA